MSVALVVRRVIDPFLKIASSTPKMTCLEFAERREFDEWLSTYIDETCRNDEFSTDYAFDRLQDDAERLGVQLTDLETWTYDRYFDNAYRVAQKGLS